MVQGESATKSKEIGRPGSEGLSPKDCLLKVAEAGPMGYLPQSDETEMKLKLLREEPADCVLRRATSDSVALKHWHFVAKLFQEDEQKLRVAGYM